MKPVLQYLIYSIPLLVVIIGFLLNRWRERISKLRDLKYQSYIDFMGLINYFTIFDPSFDLHKEMVNAYSRILLLGSKDIIHKSYELMKSIRSEKKFTNESLEMYKDLFYLMRKEFKCCDRCRFKNFKFKPILTNIIENNDKSRCDKTLKN